MIRFFKSSKGITLIALIITIIVMLILAGVSLNAIVGDNGIVTKAVEANFKSAITKYKEDTEMYVFNRKAEAVSTDEDVTTYIYAGDRTLNKEYKSRFDNIRALILSSSGGNIDLDNTDVEINEITEMNNESHRSHLAVETGELIWFAESDSDQEVKWCLDCGIKVFVKGYGFITSAGDYTIYSKGEYSKVGGENGVYCCAPDLSGFNTGATYYLTYDSSLTNSSLSTPIYNNVPENWYDYANKKWANVVTVSNSHMAYWTWIPRYMYKVVPSGVDIRFVNTENQYRNSEGITLSYMDLVSDGYMLADSFSFDSQNVSGIWVAKYEISDPVEPTGFSVQSAKSSITVQSITWEGNSKANSQNDKESIENSPVTVEISGPGRNEKFENVTLPYTIDGLSSDSKYNIVVTTPTYYTDPVVLKKEVMTSEGDLTEIVNPDLTGFNKNNTYFVTYDSTKPTIGNKIQTTADTINSAKQIATNSPSNWYDYANKKWANIMTMNNEGEAAYFVWIPRYQYKVDNDQKICDIVFISANKTSPSDGYIIPDAFTFGGKSLSGMWVSKYEVQDVAIPTGFVYQADSGNIRITDVLYTGSSKVSSGTMPNTGIHITVTNSVGTIVYNNSNAKIDTTNGFIISNLSAGEYTVSLEIPLSYTDLSGNIQYKSISQKVRVPAVSGQAAEPDISGFIQNGSTKAYYLIYESNSTDPKKAIIGDKVTEAMPSNWYNYSNRKWANIIVANSDLRKGIKVEDIPGETEINILVWIPKYEYRIDQNTNSMSIIFMNDNDSVDSGYVIPDAFKFGDTYLKGFWTGKYEIVSY